MEAESDNEVIRRSASRATARLSVTPSVALTTSPAASYDMSTSPNNDLLALARQQLQADKQKIGGKKGKGAKGDGWVTRDYLK